MANILDSDHAVSNAWNGSLPELTKPGIHSYNSRRLAKASIEDTPTRSPFPWIRALCLSVGLACIGYYAFTLADDFVYQRYENWAFDQHMAGRQAKVWSWLMETTPLGAWTGYKQPATAKSSEPQQPAESRPAPSVPQVGYGFMLGRVVIPRLGLRSIVREGADENTLRRAVGHVPSTQMAGAVGNFAIAAHRDTLFRALKDIKLGDRVSFESPQGTFDYKVVSTKVVKPSDVSVLEPRGDQKLLTMITCYPFYYVGSAPKRFIVTAQLDNSTSLSSNVADVSAPLSNQAPDAALNKESAPAAVPARETATPHGRYAATTGSRLRHSSNRATRNRQASALRQKQLHQNQLHQKQLRQKHQKPGVWHKLNPFRTWQAG
jgi:sortase A